MCVSPLLQMLHHLRRRKEMKDIWGCRHMVEARHGEEGEGGGRKGGGRRRE